jgi:peptidoglycan/LPS O-acetylase OafA/YrhL
MSRSDLLGGLEREVLMPRSLTLLIAVMLGLGGALFWVATALMLADAAWSDAAVFGPLALGVLYTAFRLSEGSGVTEPLWSPSTCLLAGLWALVTGTLLIPQQSTLADALIAGLAFGSLGLSLLAMGVSAAHRSRGGPEPRP